MTDRELMQQALEMLTHCRVFVTSREKIKHPEGTELYDNLLDAIRTRLSQCDRCGEVNPAEIHTCTPKQEPVAWGNVLPGGRITDAMESARVGDYNQGWNDYRKAAKAALEKCYTAPPQRAEGCAECGKQASEGWALYCVKCSETVQEPVGWIYEDDEGRMMFSQMPQHPPFWEPVYRAKRHD